MDGEEEENRVVCGTAGAWGMGGIGMGYIYYVYKDLRTPSRPIYIALDVPQQENSSHGTKNTTNSPLAKEGLTGESGQCRIRV